MNLQELLRSKRDVILEQWRRLIYGAYPEETAGFLKSEKDRFNNPVGHAITQGTAALLDGVLLERSEGAAEAIESLVRVRAVQEVSAAEAVAFVFQLKHVIRDEMSEIVTESGQWAELSRIEDRIDGLAATAFNVFTQCREQIYAIRVGDIKRRTASLLNRLE